MRVTDIVKKRMLFSFEVFTPKTPAGEEKMFREGGVLDKLTELQPDFISCTYGAGGQRAGNNLEVLKHIALGGRTIPVAHYTCIGNTREGIKAELETYLENGVDHILALRGDMPYGMKDTGGDFHYATELVKYIRTTFGDQFTISVAGSPEGHIASRSLEADIAFLKAKQDNGADYVTTQLCYDMEQFERWFDAIRKAGVTLPVVVGVMPVLDIGATINMALSRNGCALPRELARIISRHWVFPNVYAPNEDEAEIRRKKDAFTEEGMAYTLRQIDKYRALGVNGIHLYALNKYEAVTRLVKESGLIYP